ncbi:hypothetical protein ACIQMJ_29380 [Actinosynnema sp. NPDC091369]
MWSRTEPAPDPTAELLRDLRQVVDLPEPLRDELALAEALRPRLRSALDGHADGLFSALADRFDAVVTEHRLDSVPVPDLTGVTTPLQLTPAELEGLATWRRATRELHRVHDAHRDLTRAVTGHEPDDLTTLFDVESPEQAAAVTAMLTAHRTGREPITRYGPLLPFAIGPLCGVRLTLKPPPAATPRASRSSP